MMSHSGLDADDPRMPEDTMVLVEHLSKKFCRQLRRSLYYGLKDIGAELAGARRRDATLRPGEFWALRDVGLRLRRGESLGLVGPNGSGKTTLLRTISGIIRPDSGRVVVRGKVAPLIALGAGFNPVLTGRENIFVNMAILGLGDKEINKRLDAVIDFSEIACAIDAPVHTYSSGMAARLGFACAIHTEPDVLLVDEVLAVGDIAFRSKCYRRLAELRSRGTSMILVTHSPSILLYACESGAFLEGGQLRVSGNSRDVVRAYEESQIPPLEDATRRDVFASKRSSGTGFDIVRISFRDNNDVVVERPETGEATSLAVSCRASIRFQGLSLNVTLRNLVPEQGMISLTSATDGILFDLPAGEYELRLSMPYLCLRPGPYTMKVSVSIGSLHVLDAVESLIFEVGAKAPLAESSFYQPRSWNVVRPGAFVGNESVDSIRNTASR